jgi:predicted GNAT family acetyltransferase
MGPAAPTFVIGRDGVVVAACMSGRENEEAAECYTFTEPAFRRQGFGQRVTVAWGQAVLQSCKIAFYSYAQDNRASQALAKSLSLVRQLRLVTYE